MGIPVEESVLQLASIGAAITTAAVAGRAMLGRMLARIKEALMKPARSQATSTDAAAVVAAARDYFEGWFDGDEARMERALHPDLVKRRGGEELGITTKERMLELTRQGEGRDEAADGALDIEVEDVYGDIATATVHSSVYHEYLHLVRTSEGWRIANALWQPA